MPFCSSCVAVSNGNLFHPESKFSDFGRKPWTIIRRFDQNRPKYDIFKTFETYIMQKHIPRGAEWSKFQLDSTFQ